MSVNNRNKVEGHSSKVEILKDFFYSVSIMGALEIGLFIMAVLGVLGFIIGLFSIIFSGLIFGFLNAVLFLLVGIMVGAIILFVLFLISFIIESITKRF